VGGGVGLVFHASGRRSRALGPGRRHDRIPAPLLLRDIRVGIRMPRRDRKGRGVLVPVVSPQTRSYWSRHFFPGGVAVWCGCTETLSERDRSASGSGPYVTCRDEQCRFYPSIHVYHTGSRKLNVLRRLGGTGN
jgi:hypothetical protein